MREPTTEQLRRALRIENPWWAEGHAPDAFAKPFRRSEFESLSPHLDRSLVLALYGPRQVGKTTLMHQLIRHLLEDRKVAPRRVMFHSFDVPGVTASDREALDPIIDYFARRFQKKPVEHADPPLFVFLDEVAKVDGWARTLKGWYDLRLPLRFVISDSSQALLWRGAAEYLVGRVALEPVHPMGLADIASLRGAGPGLPEAARGWRAAVDAALQKRSAKAVLDAFRRVDAQAGEFGDRLDRELERYLLLDGFPALAGEEDLGFAREQIRQFFDLTVYKDLVRAFQIRNPRALEELAVLVASESSQRTSYEKLSQTLKIKIDTLREYLGYLESVFTTASSEFYGANRAVALRRPKKIYLRNCGLRNALAGDLTEELLEDPARLGKVVETVVADHALRLSRRLSGDSRLTYWQDGAGREVDLIIGPRSRPLPFEVKHQGKVTDADLTALRAFMDLTKCPLGLVVTRKELEARGPIVLVPLGLFLLAC